MRTPPSPQNVRKMNTSPNFRQNWKFLRMTSWSNTRFKHTAASLILATIRLSVHFLGRRSQCSWNTFQLGAFMNKRLAWVKSQCRKSRPLSALPTKNAGNLSYKGAIKSWNGELLADFEICSLLSLWNVKHWRIIKALFSIMPSFPAPIRLLTLHLLQTRSIFFASLFVLRSSCMYL